MPAAVGDARTQVILAFWRRSSGPKPRIEFFVPLAGDYLPIMSHETDLRPGIAAGSWSQESFGFTPHSYGRIFPCARGSVVVFSVYDGEARILDGFGSWWPVAELQGDPQDILRAIAAKL
jgi:hypothetical protein